MSSVNFLEILLSCMILAMIIMSSLMNSFERHLPQFIRQTFRYGKFEHKKKSAIVIEVPKAWFKHFYVYSSVMTMFSLWVCVKFYVFDSPPPQWLYKLLDIVTGGIRQPSVNPSRVLLAVALLAMQCIRRAYDTHYVSVFSEKGRINLVHYLIGYMHYTACILIILAEAPNFSKYFRVNIVLQWSDLNAFDALATMLFLWAWIHQYKATVILGNLRRNSKGMVVTQSHKLPKGDWFEYVSSPHLLAEILMYTALTIILWTNTSWWFVYFWVLTNQVEVALMSHWWYQETFTDLPKHRKILIPFVY